jgi:hypothetical protein
MGSMLDEALALSGRGFRIIPIHTPGPRGCSCDKGAGCGGSTGKHPRLRSWQNDATTDPDRIRAWWRTWPDANIGLVMGGPRRLVAVDIDGPGGRATITRLEAEHGELPATLTSRSGRADGGEHRFFHVPDGLDLGAIKNRAGKAGGPMPKVDIRTEGGQVVAPPSVHVSGNRYSWADRRTPIAVLPKWLYQLATWEPPAVVVEPPRFEPSVVERARAYIAKVPGAVSGQGGHPHTLLVAEHLVRGFELDAGTSMMILREWNRTCDPPWSEKELRHKVYEARTKGTAVRWGAHTREDRPWSAAPTRCAPPKIAPRQTPGDGASLGLLGALLDAPDLFEMPDVLEALNRVDGDLALAVAAARSDESRDVVARTPENLRSFVERRLREPMHSEIEEAARWFHHYARALARTKRQTEKVPA